MAKQAFVTKTFKPATLKMIDIINKILDKYRAQGYTLSLRQLYYQLVAGVYVENTVQSYKRIGDYVSEGRQAGLIDWDMIEDRGRNTVIPNHWDSPAQIVDVAARQFRIDKWADQPVHIECMVEKDALSGVLEPVCRDLDIGITANKGYSSSSTMYEIGKRLNRRAGAGKSITVVYLGDHDPSGIDMTRDVDDRLTLYAQLDEPIEVIRVALNMSQIDEWNPPENPAKETDSRFGTYRAKFGDSSWELDAVEPSQLAALIRQVVTDRRDDDLWNEAVDRENAMRAELRDFVTRYNKRPKV